MLGEVIEVVPTSWELFQSPGELVFEEALHHLTDPFYPFGISCGGYGAGHWQSANERSVLDSEKACP